MSFPDGGQVIFFFVDHSFGDVRTRTSSVFSRLRWSSLQGSRSEKRHVVCMPPKSEIMGRMKRPQGDQPVAQQEQVEQTPEKIEAVAKQDEHYPQMAEVRSECPTSLQGCPPGCPTHPCKKNSAGRCEDAMWPRGCPPDGCPYNGCAPGSRTEYQLVPCDLFGQRISTGRLGKWCDDPKHPKHTICVKRLPKDFCTFAKRRPNPLPKDWMSYKYDSYHTLYTNLKTRQSTWHRPVAWPSSADPEDFIGDYCCGKNKCEAGVGKPWCITPSAFQQYRENSAKKFKIVCNASLALKETGCWWSNDVSPHRGRPPTWQHLPPSPLYAMTQDMMAPPHDVNHDWTVLR